MSAIDRQRSYYQRHLAERQAYQRAYAAAHPTPYDPAPALARKAQRLTQRLAEQQAEYQADPQAYLRAYNDALPPGQYLGHCGIWQRVTELPHVCTICRVRLFEEENPHAC